MIAGGVQLAVVRGKLSHRAWSLVTAAALALAGRLVPDPRAERVALLALRLPSPRDRAGVPGRRAVPARSGVSPAPTGVDGRLRAHVRGAGGPAVRRSRPGSDLRPPQRHRGSNGTVRAAGATLACVALALALPGAASAHATLERATPDQQSSVDAVPHEVRLEFSQAVTLVARSLEVRAPDGSLVSGPGGAERRRTRDQRASDGCRARRLHGALARALVRRAHRVGCLHIRRRRTGAAADRGRGRERPHVA